MYHNYLLLEKRLDIKVIWKKEWMREKKKFIAGLEWGYNKKNKKVHFINLRVLF